MSIANDLLRYFFQPFKYFIKVGNGDGFNICCEVVSGTRT